MTDQEIQIAIAEVCQPDLWVIVKRGLFYRHNACGYTNSISEAWKLPHAEAKKYEMYADRSDVDHAEKVLIERVPAPDYPNDLNAIHEVVINHLHPAELEQFGNELLRVLGRDWRAKGKATSAFSHLAWVVAAASAEARQLSEAVLRTRGKWKD